MKKLLVVIGAALVAAVTSVQAQTNGLPPIPNLSTNKDWAVIPFGIYDIQKKDFGWGVVGLYKVTDNFWAGAKFQDIGGRRTTAGVQAQLQISGTWAGITYTPFLETSVGLGKSSVYADAGPGAYIVFLQKGWGGKQASGLPKYSLRLGLIGDYEHYVDGPAKGDEAKAGPLLHISFP